MATETAVPSSPPERSPAVLGPGPPHDAHRRGALWWTIALTASLVLWTFSSPIGSSPDEPAHMAMSWGLVTGQNVFDRTCDEIDPACDTRIIEIPAGLVPSVTCHQFRPDVPASCVQPTDRTTAPTNALRYPPLFYAVVGAAMWSANGLGFGPETVGYVGRLIGALATLSLLLPAMVMASRRVPNVTYAAVASLTPMTMFLAASINPNGVEIAGAIAAATGVVLAAREGTFRAGAGFLFVWGIIWLSWVRPLGFIWGGALIGFGALYLQPRALWNRASFRSLIAHRTIWVAVGALLSSMVWFVYSLGARNTGAGRGLSVPEDTGEQLVAIGLRWGGMLRESIGILGWLDTRLPQLLMLGLVALISSLLTLLLSADGDRTRRRVVTAFVAVMIAGITYLMYRQQFLWQGRYVLPLMAAAAIWWSGTVSVRRLGAAGRLASAMWLATTASALWVAARYGYGLERGSRFEVPNLSDDAQWFAPIGPIGLLAAAAVAAVGGVFAIRADSPIGNDSLTSATGPDSVNEDSSAEPSRSNVERVPQETT